MNDNLTIIIDGYETARIRRVLDMVGTYPLHLAFRDGVTMWVEPYVYHDTSEGVIMECREWSESTGEAFGERLNLYVSDIDTINIA